MMKYQYYYYICFMENTIGTQIKDAREAKRLTQFELAAKIRVSLDTISGLESGRKKNTSITMLQLIGEELGITFEI